MPIYEFDACGNYPANIVCDVNIAVSYLKDRGYYRSDFILLTHFKNKGAFIYPFLPTTYNYGDWLKHVGLIYAIIEDDTIQEDEMYVYATNKGFPIVKELDGLKIINSESIVRIRHVTVM